MTTVVVLNRASRKRCDKHGPIKGDLFFFFFFTRWGPQTLSKIKMERHKCCCFLTTDATASHARSRALRCGFGRVLRETATLMRLRSGELAPDPFFWGGGAPGRR